MRPARIVAAVVVVAAAAGTGAYLAVRTRPEPAAAPAATAPAATTTIAAATTTTTTTTTELAVLADGRHPVRLKAVDPRRATITFDLVQFYQGEAAAREAAKDHQESPPPNDYYVRNVNPRLRTLPVRADAAITANQAAGSNNDVPVTLAKLASLPRVYGPVFWLTVRHGQVVRVGEQWVP